MLVGRGGVNFCSNKLLAGVRCCRRRRHHELGTKGEQTKKNKKCQIDKTEHEVKWAVDGVILIGAYST